MPIFIARFNVASLAMLLCTAVVPTLCMAAVPAATQTIDARPGDGTPHPHARPYHAHHHAMAPRMPVAPGLGGGLAPGMASAAPPPVLPGSPAPVPNEALSPPDAPQQTETSEVTPAIMQLHYPVVGNGYLPGSSPDAMDDLRAAKAGGVQVTVPLSQPGEPTPP